MVYFSCLWNLWFRFELLFGFHPKALTDWYGASDRRNTKNILSCNTDRGTQFKILNQLHLYTITEWQASKCINCNSEIGTNVERFWKWQDKAISEISQSLGGHLNWIWLNAPLQCILAVDSARNNYNGKLIWIFLWVARKTVVKNLDSWGQSLYWPIAFLVGVSSVPPCTKPTVHPSGQLRKDVLKYRNLSRTWSTAPDWS